METENKVSRVTVLDEVKLEMPDGNFVCLQWVRYNYADPSNPLAEHVTAFRFMSRDSDGRMKAQRGGCGLRSLKDIHDLIGVMSIKGFSKKKGDIYGGK